MYSRCVLLSVLLIPSAQCFMAVPWHRVERRASASAGLPLQLINHNDLSYLTTVLMGTPYQAVQMAPSLSMNFIAVATPPFGGSSSTFYNQSASSSYVPSNDVASLPTVSGGSVAGRFERENCALDFTNSQSFAYIAAVALTNSSVDTDLYPIGARGVLGYGVNAPASSPVNASLIPAFLGPSFTKAVCGIELNHVDDPVPDGVFTMGAVDTTAFTGDFTNVQVPANSTVSWSIPVDSISLTTASNNTQSLPGILASVDLYHSDIQVLTSTASQIYNSIPGSAALSATTWAVPCDSKFGLTLMFAGKPFMISERDTIRKLSNGTCQGSITGGATQLIGKVGAPFMRNYYTQFGVEKFTNGSASVFVGFAAKKVRTAHAATSSGASSSRSPPLLVYLTLAIFPIVVFVL